MSPFRIICQILLTMAISPLLPVVALAWLAFLLTESKARVTAGRDGGFLVSQFEQKLHVAERIDSIAG